MISPNANAWLDLISYAEGTYDPNRGGRQYDIMFGGGRFKDLSRHPDTVVSAGGYNSAAAGAYQFMPATWASTGGGAMSPERQDIAALELIRRRGVDPDVDPINPRTVAKLSPEWASLPTIEGKSYYGQPVRSFEELSKFSGVTQPQVDPGYTTTQPKTPNVPAPLKDENISSGLNEADVSALLKSLGLGLSQGGIENTAFYLGDPEPIVEEQNNEKALASLLQRYASEENASSKQMPVERSLPKTMFDSTVEGIQKLASQAMSAFRPGKSVL